MARTLRSQLTLPLSSIRNSELFSSHWLTNRLPLEPECRELRDAASTTFSSLTDLWRAQRTRVKHYGGEQALEQAFIQPVFSALGWKLIYQTYLRGRKPDYALFISEESVDASLSAGRQSSGFWKFPAVVADAKAWNFQLDRPTVVNQQREYPPEQIEWYLNNSNLDYAILTNGKIWRLIPRVHETGQPRFQTYLECDLCRLLDDRLSQTATLFNVWPGFEDFLSFYIFFSPEGFVRKFERAPLVERARTGSTEYRMGVGEELKARVFDALSFCIEGFLSHPENRLKPQTDLEPCREQSLTLLYRLLFILFAEDRKLLPYRVDRSYTENRSLGRFRDAIAAKLERIQDGREADYEADRCELWPDLVSLFDLIDSGSGRYRVPAYNGGLFDPELHPFLREKVLPDRYLARVIDQLGRATDPRHREAGHVRVDYRDLAIQHLGDVYEGLLALQPHYASEEMVVVRNREAGRNDERVFPATAPLESGFERTDRRYPKGSVYLLTETGERRASGSYYTPNDIVDYIVDKTLGPLCEQIELHLRKEIDELEGQIKVASNEQEESLTRRLDSLRGEFEERVLNTRVLDPAMGSGHFLIRACRYLAEQIATNPYSVDPNRNILDGDEPILTYWKRRVAEDCLYGVDKNAMAVELAKLALWLETVAVNQPLTFLDHHLRHGDSLIGAMVDDLGSLPDAPPLMANIYQQQIEKRIPTLLDTLALIRKTPSDTIQQVKTKDQLFHKQFEPVRRPFRQVADLWCSTLFLEPSKRLTLEQYKAALDRLDKPNRLATLLEQEPYKEALKICGREEMAAVHWQLEFPEVFLGGSNSTLEGKGFHAVIGNPPYDVLSEKETGRNLSSFKSFIKRSPVYHSSRVGKNNLYKLFICRSLSLLAENGRLGFITPMAVLGDEQASGIRGEILHIGRFTNVEAFPQKDDPRRRVFRDAKLPTSIIIVSKDNSLEKTTTPFAIRVHPANKIEPGSNALTLTSADIPLYDPENLTIVSCSQADWDLAVRLMQCGNFRRLGETCVSYQGEVNETNARAKGTLGKDSVSGPLILRGSNVCLYVLREASQGEALYLRESAFLKGRDRESKAFHGRQHRVGFQRSSPQNNFRRLVACFIPAGEYCFDTVSYVPAEDSKLPLLLLLALLNSKLLDWYFRLGSTNSKVNEYQFKILPCPIFSTVESDADGHMYANAISAMKDGRLKETLEILSASLKQAPFSGAVAAIMMEAVRKIMKIEAKRADITRAERSSLAPEAQELQDLIDQVLYKMVKLTKDEVKGLEKRLAEML